MGLCGFVRNVCPTFPSKAFTRYIREIALSHFLVLWSSYFLGSLFYKQNDLEIFRIDAKEHHHFAQNLCLYAKLFIDHKTIMYDLDTFEFYILIKNDTTTGHEILGFFSKEKVSPENHNLSCILVFPQFQRKGYGRLLIEMSYEIYRKDGLIGMA